jgi:hypothetical protein
MSRECVGCSFCCQTAQCYAAPIIAQPGEVCPYLFWSETEGRYLCTLVMGDSERAKRFAYELSIGEGCCSNMNTWREEVKQRKKGDY